LRSLTFAAMPSKGLRRATLSTDTKLDAGDAARKPLNPLLGIAVVVRCVFFIYFLLFRIIVILTAKIQTNGGIFAITVGPHPATL